MKQLWRTLRFLLGWLFIVLGLAGLFLPFLQGILFLAIGLALLARDSPWARRLLGWMKRRWPRQYKRLENLQEGAARRWKKLRTRGREPGVE